MNVKVFRSYDYAQIGEIMRHPRLYQVDDFGPPREDFKPREDPAIWYVMVEDAGELLGLFAIAEVNAICWEVHTRLLPHAWGDRAAAAAQALLAWLWAETPCRRLITCIPAFNRLAVRFASRAGLEWYGTNAGSFQRDGRLYSQFLLGISKPE